MSRVYLLVEGQTEEAFVNELLLPHYARLGIYLTPIIVSTRPGFRGGLVTYAKVRPQIERLCKQDPDARVTTVFDLYALPLDFPGIGDPACPDTRDGEARAQWLEAALGSDVGQNNFLPNFLVHEFEALLFSRLDAFEEWTDDERALDPLRSARATAAPEAINDGRHTAPSKRILAALPGYQKTFHGPLIACAIGLDAIRAACPHFDRWLKAIEAPMARRSGLAAAALDCPTEE